MIDGTVITATVAARQAGVNVRSMINALVRGHVKGHKVGPIWIVDAVSLEEYIRRRQEKASQKRGEER